MVKLGRGRERGRTRSGPTAKGWKKCFLNRLFSSFSFPKRRIFLYLFPSKYSDKLLELNLPGFNTVRPSKYPRDGSRWAWETWERKESKKKFFFYFYPAQGRFLPCVKANKEIRNRFGWTWERTSLGERICVRMRAMGEGRAVARHVQRDEHEERQLMNMKCGKTKTRPEDEDGCWLFKK